MPRSAAIAEESGTVHPDLTNGFTKEAAIGFVSEIEAEQAKIDEIMAQAKVDCQPHIDQIKAIKKRAAEQNFEKKAFAAVLSKRRHERKAEQADSALNDEQKEKFRQIELFVDDHPL